MIIVIISYPLISMEHEKRIQKYQFSLKQLLGQGSYASVYRGKVIATGEPVAVKVIDKRLFTSAFNIKNLHSEIEIMKKVSHKNIVKLHDVFQTANNMYIVTQICDYDLYSYLKNKRKMPEEDAINFLKQILEGIKYLNNMNIIHRDLKPANILIKGTQCKLSDFGFAKNIENQNTFLKSIVGTPLYMSPQLLQKQKYTNKSDLWSVGLIYYQMLHGKTPWMANNQLQLINAIYHQKIIYSKCISDLSKDFIEKCLAINEEKRISWEEAFEHSLIPEEKISITAVLTTKIKSQKVMKSFTENRSAITVKECLKGLEENNPNSQNNSHVINFNNTMKREDARKDISCHTPRLTKNISEIKLKKVEALTPKSTFNNINNKLKQVWALNINKSPLQRGHNKSEKDIIRRKRNLTTLAEPKQSIE